MSNSTDEPGVRISTDDALGADDACGLAGRLSRGEVSAAELRDAAIARAHALNPRLNAVTTWVDPPPSQRPDPAAPFLGVPTAIKDNEDLVGFATSQGSRAVPDAPAPRSSPWVRQFLGLGVVPIAKTTLPEFGLTASTESSRFGATRNPWHTGHSVGGSSGGSATLVAAGVVPVAHANDGGGSIRIPAACAGLVGLKPTRGRLLDRPELERLPVPITRQGVLTRTVRDTARYLWAAEQTYRNSALPPVGWVEAPSRDRLRIGLLTHSVPGLPVEADVVESVTRAGLLCERLGHRVEPAELPVDDGFGRDFLHYWSLLAFILQRAGSQVFGPGFDPSQTEALTRALSARAVRNAPYLPGAVRRLRRLARAHDDGFADVDVVLSPVLGHEPPPIGWLGPDVEATTHLVRLLRWTSFTPVQNVSGTPAISVPLGTSASGLPLGVQLGAPFGQERRLLELAYELEAAAPFATLW